MAGRFVAAWLRAVARDCGAVSKMRKKALAPLQRMLDWYFTKVSAAGYTLGHQADGAEHVLGGRSGGGGAFLLVVRARDDGGSDVDLMADGG